MADFYRARLGDIVTTRMKHDEKIKRINVRSTKVQQQISEQNELYSRNTSEIVISVSADAAGGSLYNKETGKLLWEQILQPNETKKITYRFDVKYPKIKVIAGL